LQYLNRQQTKDGDGYLFPHEIAEKKQLENALKDREKKEKKTIIPVTSSIVTAKAIPDKRTTPCNCTWCSMNRPEWCNNKKSNIFP